MDRERVCRSEKKDDSVHPIKNAQNADGITIEPIGSGSSRSRPNPGLMDLFYHMLLNPSLH